MQLSLQLALTASSGTHMLAPQATFTNRNVRKLTGGNPWGFL